MYGRSAGWSPKSVACAWRSCLCIDKAPSGQSRSKSLMNVNDDLFCNDAPLTLTLCFVTPIETDTTFTRGSTSPCNRATAPLLDFNLAANLRYQIRLSSL